MVIEWNKFKGTAKGKDWSASIEMMDLPNPFWQTNFTWVTAEAMESQIEHFEEGKLGQAYVWCTKQLTEHEERTNQVLDKANS